MHRSNEMVEYHLETFKKIRKIEIPGNNEFIDIFPITEDFQSWRSEELVLVNSRFQKNMMFEAKKLNHKKEIR
jgi:hypothetical protein